MTTDRRDAINAYWFGAPDDPEFGSYRDHWFRSGPEVDVEITTLFQDDYQRARAGAFDSWRDHRLGCLALILLFDQFPRNMYRGKAQSYATDAEARALARFAIEHGYDRHSLLAERQFLYLPFEHSEDIDDQRRGVALFGATEDHDKKEDWICHAVKHLEIIERFGRFPHRNAILGRKSTEEEVRFLTENDDVHFGTDRHREWREANRK